MLDSSIQFEKAKPEDYEELILLFDKANEYSRRISGDISWSNMVEATKALKEHISAGECYVIRDKGSIAATVSIEFKDDLWDDDQNAVYIHKLMKDPQSSITRVGLLSMKFAAEQAINHKKEFVRADSWIQSKRLIEYCKRLGFVERGNFVYWQTGRTGVRIEVDSRTLLKEIATYLP